MTDQNQEPKIGFKRALPFLIFAMVATGLTAGSYLLLDRFLRDRQAVLTRHSLPPRPVYDRPNVQNGRQVKTYSAKELEEARQKGRLPSGSQQNLPSQSNLAQQDAVQRSLRTLDEINRINQMNQRLLEQQQRIQNRQR